MISRWLRRVLSALIWHTSKLRVSELCLPSHKFRAGSPKSISSHQDMNTKLKVYLVLSQHEWLGWVVFCPTGFELFFSLQIWEMWRNCDELRNNRHRTLITPRHETGTMQFRNSDRAHFDNLVREYFPSRAKHFIHFTKTIFGLQSADPFISRWASLARFLVALWHFVMKFSSR